MDDAPPAKRFRFTPMSSWMGRPSQEGPHLGAASVFSGMQRLALLAGFTLLLILRLPLAWLHGRFFGEEGTIFLAFAWHRPASVAMWRSFAGYLNLAANASTVGLADLVRGGVLPLEFAPYFTMVIATLVQLLPAILILTGQARWLASRWSVIAGLLIIAMSPSTEEVFANVLHIQFHLALSAALILVLDIPSARWARIAYWVPLLLAPLCGPGAIVILPIFVARTLVDQDKARLVQTLMLGLASALQLLFFYSKSPVRGHLLDPAEVANLMFLRFAVMPFFTAIVAEFVGWIVDTAYTKGGGGWWYVTTLSAAYFGWLFSIALRGFRDSAFWLIVTGLAIGAVSFGAGMLPIDPSNWFSVGSGERYNFLPEVLLGLGLVAAIMRGESRYRRACCVLLVLTLVSGAATFCFPNGDLQNGPDWRTQVAVWRKNHDFLLAGSPKTWLIDLSDRDRPCTPPNFATPSATDPRYCESSWFAVVRRDSLKKAWGLSR